MSNLSESDYSSLLKIFSELDERNKDQKRQGVHDYSLMNALLKKTDEVHLHSNFIYSMINPNGSHYHDNKFLKLFLDSINENNFIDIDNARVHKEKGKIDLLVEDGEHYLIIENKLRAVDQKYQISRYIHYIIDKYLDGNDEEIDEKIRVIYLSEYKAKPSLKSESIIGFELKDGVLTRNNESISELTLPKKDTKIKFNKVKHSKHLDKWIIKSKKYLTDQPNSEMLIYAFEEYRLILERLKSNNWRNVMSLDEYLLTEDKEKQEIDEEKMYQFMKESSRVLNDYSGKKLYRVIDKLIKDKKIEIIKEKSSFINNPFEETRCINWFKKKGEKEKWRDVGFIFKYKEKKYIFLMGVVYIYLHQYDVDKGLNTKERFARNDIFGIIQKFDTLIK